MIARGWEKIGFLDAWDHDVQVYAAELNAVGALFPSGSNEEAEEVTDLPDDAEWLGDSTLEEQMRNDLTDNEDGLNFADEEIPDDSISPQLMIPQIFESEIPSPVVTPLDLPAKERIQQTSRKRKAAANPRISKPAVVLDSQHGHVPNNQAFSPLGSWGSFGITVNLLEQPILKKISEKHGKTPAQVSFRWGIQMGNSVLPKSRRPERLKENFDVFNFYLDDEDKAEIEKLEQKRFLRDDFLCNERSYFKTLARWFGAGIVLG
ncbi:hypothetical protein R1sor_025658 [Riccia sorocarpa]|uniref:NADP-dependent oxidoreductase domain-containing protein n=1 Tax=Riccia sorocarpa TaxID=122646 RepID=A0ABD3GCA1_9MARC